MKVQLERSKSGDVLVVIQFEEDSNFDVKKMQWVPRLKELDLILDAKKLIMDKERGELK